MRRSAFRPSGHRSKGGCRQCAVLRSVVPALAGQVVEGGSLIETRQQPLRDREGPVAARPKIRVFEVRCPLTLNA